MRTSALFVALIAVLGGLLTALPAEAASYKVYLKSPRVAIDSSGNGKVAVKCNTGRSTCKGKIYFLGESGSARVRAYRVGAGKTAYVRVSMRTNSTKINPNTKPGSGFRAISNVRLRINEDSPKNITHDYRLTTETLVKREYIRGTVLGTGEIATGVTVELIRTLRGGNTQLVSSKYVANGGSFAFGANLGANNSPSEAFRLRIIGSDQDGQRRSWFWRGSGGGSYLRDSQTVRAVKTGTTANFRYHTIKGTTEPGAEVSIVGTPRSFGGGAAAKRELDFPSCGNIFGQTKASAGGAYSIGFIPQTSLKRYMVGVKSGSTKAYYGSGSERFGSCYDALNYRLTVTNSKLLSLPSTVTKAAPAGPNNTTLRVDASFSSSYKPTYNDRWIRLREKIPGLGILDSPVVREVVADSHKRRSFSNIAPGDYWVEVGRRTGCSDWYGSVFPNNRLYFKGADRYAENWKSFKRVRDLSGNSSKGLESYARNAKPNPATNAQNSIPRGKRGWMYRNYCKALGKGTINSVRISDSSPSTVVKKTSRNGKGGIVSGRVSRIGGKTNKEMLVRLSTSSGSRVVRTDVTDSSGRFYIAGLSSGRYTISVNSDSWRGIGRSFSGRKSVTVKAGRTKSVGTLRFRH